ncbi:BspA family leucine-rich repeat surface protein [Lactococcus petauri]|uniref:MucBP domain-containing protein n=1 Tax=Lactococcus petauri TaxID=1940789 RepID=UPI0013FDD1E5|nr:MucBP domain-containing protein [Lactococcus petauri]NHI75010.1 BspA family leucine-rich repeat surface protein [Lactococcus petauri]
MINYSQKTIKRKLRTTSQWLLIGLLTSSVTLPNFSSVVHATTGSRNTNLDTPEVADSSGYSEDEQSVENSEKEINSIENQVEGGDDTSGNAIPLADVIASGTLNTVSWEIDANGVLHISGGQLPDSVMTSGRSPFGNASQINQITSIVFEGPVTAGNSLEMFFMNLKNVKNIENLNFLDVSQTTNMHYLFFGMSSLATIDVSTFDTRNVTDMSQMFTNMKSLVTLDVSNFDTSSVTKMGQMFYGTSSLTSLDLSNFETPSLTNMAMMFGYSGLKSLDISNFNTTQALMGADTFWGTSLEHIKLGKDFIFKDSLLNSPPIDETYIGKWQKDNSSYIYTSSELANNYDGSLMSGDWYWATTQLNINVHDSTIYVGDVWKAEDNFDSAVDRDGNLVDYSQVTVDDSQVDTSKAGIYEVKYSYGGAESTATLTIKDKLTAVNVYDSTIYVGDTWKAEDNFDSAVDRDGNLVDYSQVTVDDSQVDTSKAGVYEAKYKYDGVESTATVTVINHPIQNSEVIVNYIDTDGNKILGDIVKTGNIGETYNTEQKSIEGYTFKEVQGKPSGQFTNQAQTVTYVYTKNEIPNLTGTVLVKYVDTDGNKISDEVVKSGTVGEDYSTEKKAIKGYTFKEIRGKATGQFKDQSQTVTYVYTTDKNDTVNREPENKPSSNDKNNNQGTISSDQQGLPVTGENERMTMMSIILGLILVALATVVSIFRFKKANK